MQHKLNTFQRVRGLTGWHAVAFAATLVQRMQPNYQLFCQVTHYLGAEQFACSLDLVWEWLSSPKAKINFALQLEKLEEITPDAQAFDNYGVFPAIDAAVSLASTLSLILGEDPRGAVVVSKLSQGSVEAFVEASAEQALSTEEIKSHGLMQWEVGFQQDLLDTLDGLPTGKQGVAQLKAMAKEEGISNIGIEIG